MRRDRTAVTAGFGLLRLAGAPSLGWLDVKASGGAEIPQIEAAVDEELARLRAEGPDAPRRWSGRRPSWNASGWTGSPRSPAGPTNCAGTRVLFGDPQLAFTAVDRVLDITAEEVRAVAAARLRPDNRAVLVYEPVTADDPADRRTARPAQPTRTTSRTEPGGDRRRR